MYRYFHLFENNQTAAVEIVDGTNAETAPLAEFEKLFGSKIKEISRQKYQAINREFDLKRELELNQ